MKISEALATDHAYLDTCYYSLKAASTPSDQLAWRNQLIWNLARHAISEELTVYPAMEKWLGVEGKALAKEDFEQHQAVKEDLSKLQNMSPQTPEFWTLLETLITDLHTHIEHEKNHDMPRLESVLPPGESEKIALSFARTKKFVPTKSHPSAPTSSVLSEGLAGLLAAPFDKLRDLLQTFPEGAGEGTEVDWRGKL
ncbi:hypothetical protein GLAREA_09476 [Glarea lozoyensis ATCC 20868]|uniref:Hemerythrin-like domain-containing protein n=1 Tax=Glarea lozoyensis (strain ATCC 20868 / MF5171) TaxID=1116229 RepID=S3D8M9_GLAL2|nr:uncharacterized protein GLAREA_09476 [Glarea lozoyensis ATCC 20868]EPE28356.1 hypothetical protein GLAREA_09476 [Glarea lozoyensis ATCC 20868]